MRDVNISCMNAYLEHGRRAWRALFTIIVSFLLICGLCVVCHKLRNTEYLIGWLLFAMLAPVGLFLQRSVKEFIEELHCSSRAIVRVRSVDGRSRHIISAFESLIERVASTNINDANLYFDNSANEARLATTCYDQWHDIDAQCTDSSSAGRVQLCISRGGIHLTGRDNSPEHEYALELLTPCVSPCRMLLAATPRASSNLRARVHSAIKERRRWLLKFVEMVYLENTRAEEGTVEVMVLYNKWGNDGLPVWEPVRKEKAVASDISLLNQRISVGTMLYTEAAWSQRLLSIARFVLDHGGRIRAPLFVSGPKGAGKTIFVEWLAGRLGVPVYHMSLRSPLLDDASLSQLLMPSTLSHNLPVLFHVDEFQALFASWCEEDASPNPKQFTIEGVQNMLEGMGTSLNVLFVFTSSEPLPELDSIDKHFQKEWRGLLRRFPENCRQHIPSLSWTEARTYLSNFLKAYYPPGKFPKIADETWESVKAAWDTSGQQLPFEFFSSFAKTRLIQAFVAKKLIRKNFRYYAVIDQNEISDSFTDWFFTSSAVIEHFRDSQLRY